ncbi:MAG: hypothetical protein KDA24_01745 [Deltaproteobacteria bacterium]|nr:hypothetical protein [Deltaproteobacteria bacterium]
MIRSQIEFEIREPTGLRLGTYDIFMIRQKIYTGELKPRCEYRDERGAWNPLSTNPLFNPVIKLMNPDGSPAVDDDAPRTAPRIAGWSSNKDAEVSRGEAGRSSRPTGKRPEKKKGGLLSRFFGKK